MFNVEILNTADHGTILFKLKNNELDVIFNN